MRLVSDKELLVIAPHFKYFIKDQTYLLGQYFKHITILMPTPQLSKIAQKLPIMSPRFSFLNAALSSNQNLAANFTLMPSSYFTLPLDVIRKRNCYLSANSCMNKISKSGVVFDLLHAHFIDMGFIGSKLKDSYNKPLILTAHGGDVYNLPLKSVWYRNMALSALAAADQIITVSKFMAEQLFYLGCPENKVNIIPNGYNEFLFSPSSKIDARKKLGLPQDKKIILSVGNLAEVKGHIYLIEAISKVVKYQDVTLIIVGSGPLKDALKKRASDLSISDKVLFIGQKPHEDIPIYMNACDLFVLPSLSESFGVVLIEALACGKPVVATKVGGIPEIVLDDVGILVEPRNSTALSDALIRALERKWVSAQIVHYANNFRLTEVSSRIVKVYSLVMRI